VGIGLTDVRLTQLRFVEHSGQVGSSGFINNPTNTAATQQVIKWVVNQVKDMDHVIGIELLNEATEDVTLLDGWCEFASLFLRALELRWSSAITIRFADGTGDTSYSRRKVSNLYLGGVSE
jgi:aryl-phospho-beta-D-glucosidase BglC (GH1 family)